MKIIVFISGLVISLDSWAGLEVQRCSNVNLESPINLCFESPLYEGNIKIIQEKIALKFSIENQPRSEFILRDGRIGKIQLLGTEALIQIDDEPLIHLNCDLFIPGVCR